MRCPFCAHEDSQVKDSRPSEDGAAIRRRRQCEACGARFTTFERVQLRDLTVIKKEGKREPFDRDKLARAIGHACRKRDIDPAQIDRLVSGIQRQMETLGDEVRSARNRRGGDGRPQGARPRRLHPVCKHLQGLQRPRRFRRDRRAGREGRGSAHGTRSAAVTIPAKPVIVLVRPQLGQNIGKAARAMLNFGLTEMRLVAPRDGWPNPDAGPAASGADIVLEQALVFDTVAEAIADCSQVFASTVRRRDLVMPVLGPVEMADRIAGQPARPRSCSARNDPAWRLRT